MSNRIIRIAESELREIVKESIKKILGENDELAVNIDIANIPINVLRSIYFDYRLIPTPIMYDHPLYQPYMVKEAIGDIMEPDEVVRNIRNKYGLPEICVRKLEQHHKIYVYVITAVIGQNAKLIEQDMEKLGYYLGAVGDVMEIEGMKFQILQFEPTSQMQEDITDAVTSKFKTLYHWTPAYNIDEIMSNGLIPFNKSDRFKYPPRIYLIEGDSSKEQMESLGRQLCLSNHSDKNNGEYALLSINIDGLDESVRFYYDPNSAIGIYTEQPIQKERVKVCEVVKFNNTVKP